MKTVVSFTNIGTARFAVITGIVIFVTLAILLLCLFQGSNDEKHRRDDDQPLNASASQPYVSLVKPVQAIEREPIDSEHQTVVVRDYMKTTSRSFGKIKSPHHHRYHDPLLPIASDQAWRHYSNQGTVGHPDLRYPSLSQENSRVTYDDEKLPVLGHHHPSPLRSKDIQALTPATQTPWFVPRARIRYTESSNRVNNNYGRPKKKSLLCECTDKEHEMFEELQPLENGYVPVLDPQFPQEQEKDHEKHRRKCKKTSKEVIEREESSPRSDRIIQSLNPWYQQRKDIKKKPEVRNILILRT